MNKYTYLSTEYVFFARNRINFFLPLKKVTILFDPKNNDNMLILLTVRQPILFYYPTVLLDKAVKYSEFQYLYLINISVFALVT